MRQPWPWRVIASGAGEVATSATIRSRFDSLSPREREGQRALVARGLLNKQVAGELGLAK